MKISRRAAESAGSQVSVFMPHIMQGPEGAGAGRSRIRSPGGRHTATQPRGPEPATGSGPREGTAQALGTVS